MRLLTETSKNFNFSRFLKILSTGESMAILILADGTIFKGESLGAEGITTGETVFTTGMTGYFETLTDPSYFGQIVTQTFPLIGNYGVIPEDAESRKSFVKGYIVRNLCEMPSNFRCKENLDSFLKEQNIIGIKGIDTRKLTKILRETGVMNGIIASGKEELKIEKILENNTEKSKFLEQIKSFKIENAVKSVSRTSIEKPNAENAKKIVLWDFGAKQNIQRELEKRGFSVFVVPYNTTFKEILNFSPDGIMLSNGPGDPSENTAIINEIKNACDYGKIPIFGICLGHQMLALANGAKTEKLKYGHRGGNHPVKDLQSGRVYISSQNHGYAVKNETIPKNAELSFVNCNDGTCEGIAYKNIPAFSVQFHPEACGGPHDTNFLFDSFIKMINALGAGRVPEANR